MPVTLKDVAQRAGVSIQTVSNVMNRRVNVRPRTRIKVLTACEELNYRPNAAARSLVTQKSKVLGLVLPDITNPIFGDIFATMARIAERYGYALMVGNTGREAVPEQRIVNLLVEQRVDGVVLTSGNPDNSSTDPLLTAKIPVVRLLFHPVELNTDFFGVDDCNGTRMATEHLISLGHRELGFLRGMPSSLSTRREQGFLDAMRAAGLPVNRDWVVGTGFTRISGYNAAMKLFKTGKFPTGFVCNSDLVALGMADAVYDSGMTIPRDMSLTGFDDIFASSIRPLSLTTIKFDIEVLAESAILRLIRRLNSETEITDRKYYVEDCRLIVRGSCAPPRR
jgi:LacI family transcriptional regulator